MDLNLFFKGLTAGILMTFLFQAILIYLLILYLTNPNNRLTKPSPGMRDVEEKEDEGNASGYNEHLLPWPEAVEARLRRSARTDLHTLSLEADLFNLVVDRMFLVYRGSKVSVISHSRFSESSGLAKFQTR